METNKQLEGILGKECRIFRPPFGVINPSIAQAAVTCDMKIIGWNYPLDGNLQDLIESANLHPITCLKSLSSHDKKSLLEASIVLCKSLRDEKTLLSSIGLSEAKSRGGKVPKKPSSGRKVKVF